MDQLEKLYNDVEWFAYTNDLPLLQQALSQSLDVLSAWDTDELVGLVRIIGDGLTIIYVQDHTRLKYLSKSRDCYGVNETNLE